VTARFRDRAEASQDFNKNVSSPAETSGMLSRDYTSSRDICLDDSITGLGEEIEGGSEVNGNK